MSVAKIKKAGIHGIRWPLQASGQGYYAPCKDEAEDIKQSIWHCLFVGPGEQMMHPEGFDIRALVWEPADEVFESLAKLGIKNILSAKEKRIVVTDVEASRGKTTETETQVHIGIYYYRRGSRLVDSLITDVVYSRQAA